MSITRQAFLNRFEDKQIYRSTVAAALRELEATDPEFAEQADRINQSFYELRYMPAGSGGLIDTEQEFKRLFGLIDNLDNDGFRASMDFESMGGRLAVKIKDLAVERSVFSPKISVIPQTAAHQAVFDAAQELSSSRDALRGMSLELDPKINTYSKEELLEKYGPGMAYGANNPWVNNDPGHALPANVLLRGLVDVWKCNLFGGNVLYRAGFETPKYGNRARGEYPNANTFYKWSDRHARSYRNKPLLNLLKEARNLQELSPAAHKKKAYAALIKATPGTMLTVDHVGDETTNGGHVRIVIENTLQIDQYGNVSGGIISAQAQTLASVIKYNSFKEFLKEDNIWVLEPNTLRNFNIV